MSAPDARNRIFRIYMHVTEEVERDGEPPCIEEVVQFNARKVILSNHVWLLGRDLGDLVGRHVDSARNLKDLNIAPKEES